MKKEKELEYSRALVPIKKKIYFKIMICLIISIIALISYLIVYQKWENLKKYGNLRENPEKLTISGFFWIDF